MAASEHHTLSSFRARFKHAPTDNDAMMQDVLDEAASRTPPGVWGEQTRAGHGYLAAHILGMEPYGRDARLDKGSEQTTYGVLRERMEQELGAAVTARTT